MLSREQWSLPKVQPFTLADFVGWLQTKNPKRRYEFHRCDGKCLLGQYMAERGREWNDGAYCETCEQVFGDTWNVPILVAKPHTFGAALKRAHATLAEQTP